MLLSKILNAGTALAVSGVLLGSAITSSCWAMEKEYDQRKIAKTQKKPAKTIASAHVKILEKYALEIIEHHNKDQDRLNSDVLPSACQRFEKYQMDCQLFGFKPKAELFDLREDGVLTEYFYGRHSSAFSMQIDYFFDTSCKTYSQEHMMELDINKYNITYKNSEEACKEIERNKKEFIKFTFQFKPVLIEDFLSLNNTAYEKLRREKDRARSFGSREKLNELKIFTKFDFQPNEFEKRHDHEAFLESCYRALYTFTRPEALNRLKIALSHAEFFEDYKQHVRLVNDEGGPFYILPEEINALILHNMLVVKGPK